MIISVQKIIQALSGLLITIPVVCNLIVEKNTVTRTVVKWKDKLHVVDNYRPVFFHVSFSKGIKIPFQMVAFQKFIIYKEIMFSLFIHLFMLNGKYNLFQYSHLWFLKIYNVTVITTSISFVIEILSPCGCFRIHILNIRMVHMALGLWFGHHFSDLLCIW